MIRRKFYKRIAQVLIISMIASSIDIFSMRTVSTPEQSTTEIYVQGDNESVSSTQVSEENDGYNEGLQASNCNLVSEPEGDIDNDGLTNGLEQLFGADPDKVDTDEDGLDDFNEIKLNLNPAAKDSNNDGILDSEDDSDNDGLSNAKEVSIGTNLAESDTDNDGISDSEEVNIYRTSPINADSDKDGIYDGDEVKLNLSPVSSKTDGVTEDSERKIGQALSKNRISEVIEECNYEFKPEVSGNVSGSLDRKVYVNAYDTAPIENISGLEGGAVNIDSECSDNDELNLSFDCQEYINNNTQSDINDLAICSLEDNTPKIINTEVNKSEKKVSANIKGSGIYFVVNTPKLLAANTSNKTLKDSLSISDSDYDGIEDSKDSLPNNNNFSGTLKTGQVTSKVSYTMDYRNFFSASKQYNSNVATVSSLFSADIYKGSSINGLNLDNLMAQHGIKDIKDYNLAAQYKDADVSEAHIGHRKVTYNGVSKEIIVIVVRGTNGTIEEWQSNFDIGTTVDKSKYSDWVVSTNHKGFDVAATRILRCLDEYEKGTYIDKTAKKTYWVMGHSRGAGIANIIGARLVNSSKEVYDYTFASPSTTTASNAENTNDYPGIYNIINKDDFVPCLPVAKWGFKHYGKSYALSVRSYEKEWEKLTGIMDYNSDTFGMDDTIKEIGKIMNGRNDAYLYTCKCHGDNSSNNITIKNYGTSKKSREGAIAKIPSNALPYCKIVRYDGVAIVGWNFTVCQQPEYFMQLIAAFMANKINAYRFALELNIADRYKKAKLGLIKSGIGGLAHPHYNESYYLLTKHI